MGLTDYTKNNNPNDPNSQNNSGGGFPPIMGIPIPMGPNGKQVSNDDIMSLFINYNEKFQNAQNVMFRDKIIEQLLSILIGKDKPNALLIGPAGTGKTAIVETIAKMLATDDPLIPTQLKGYTIWELPLANVVAGASLVGQLEENVKMVIAKMEDPNEKAILFIDEIHQILGDSQTYTKIAQILKPALARGNMHVIGATTLQEANAMAKDPAFNRRFSRVLVNELTRPQTVEILKHAKPSFVQHYFNQVIIDDDLLDMVATLADQYRPIGSHRPDNALTLLDRTVGEAVVNRQVKVTYLQNQVKNDPSDVMSANMLQALQNNPQISITENQIKKTAIALATGNSKRDTIDMTLVKQEFARIKGQDDAVQTSIKMIARRESNLFPNTRPVTMMFIGPSGVGKTEIAKIIAHELTGQKPIILNMTEYSDESTINRIIGAPAGYIGSDSNTELPFDELESNPYAVILLDEFEKAHASVQRLFYTVFDEGNLTDNHGKVIDFSKAIIIATTNAGFQEIKHTMGFGATKKDKETASIEELSKFFDPALINRFTYKVQFNTISKDIYREIVANTYEKEAKRIKTDNMRIQIPDTLSDQELDDLTEKTYHETFGARPAFNAVKEFIEDMVFQTP